MHFTYAPLDKLSLMQGDVLERTPAINGLLKEVHPHFFGHDKNLYFMVLTQSCDLVRRDGQVCAATYISIAPVRTLDLVVQRYVQQLKAAKVKAALPVLGQKSKDKVGDFLRRLLNNNQPGYFYLDASDTSLPEDCAAFLSLSIAIKSELHFDKCLNAKILQLKDTFQAKLGWLVGQQYSRVGTEDWPPGEMTDKVNKALKDAAIWVDDKSIRPLEEKYSELADADGDLVMSAPQIKTVMSKVPTRKQQVLARTESVLREVLAGDPTVVEKLRRRLESDAALTTLLK